MAKEYEVKCPHCKFSYTLRISDSLGLAARTSGMRGGEEKQPELVLPESLNENNWFDLDDPCPVCHRAFSYNLVTGESRE